jgi:hypothetical protein
MSTPVNGLNITQTGLVKFDGTSAFTSTTTTQYNVLVGSTSNAIANVAPSATSGVPLISQGSSANPAFGTAVVAGGGTGIVTTTAYAPICGGTTATGNFQAASTGFSTSGYVLTSNGSAALPSFQATGATSFQVVTQVFAASGTYTPTSGMKYCIVEVVGGGGGGAGAAATGASTITASGGGGGGEYARDVISAATIGASQTVTIGAAGTVGSASTGGTGGTSSLGALITCIGGSGGVLGGVAVTSGGFGGAGGTGGTGGSVRTAGQNGFWGIGSLSPAIIYGGLGGSTQYGAGGIGSQTGVGGAALGYGAGGSGSSSFTSAAARTGGAAKAGIIIITEYVLASATIVTTLPWTEITSATQAFAVNNGYVTNRALGVTYTLPASGSVGDVIRISGKSGISTVNQNALQQIVLSSASTTVGVGGSIASTNTGDCIELICTTGGTSTVWRANGQIGVWSVT